MYTWGFSASPGRTRLDAAGASGDARVPFPDSGKPVDSLVVEARWWVAGGAQNAPVESVKPRGEGFTRVFEAKGAEKWPFHGHKRDPLGASHLGIGR
jgi:hypothetical protein